MPDLPVITLSIVSHRQGDLILPLLHDIQKDCPGKRIQVALTLNLPETLLFRPEDFGFPLLIITNKAPRGFGSNHNRAFASTGGDFFCVLNPDVRFSGDPFSPLCRRLGDHPDWGVIAPLVQDRNQRIADNARFFPTPLRILKRLLHSANPADYPTPSRPIRVDWLAGLFLLFPRRAFAAIKGFDERYYLYYEDVDLCARLRLSGYGVFLDPAVTIRHDAGRHSHRQLKYLRWHLTSMVRFFNSEVSSALKRCCP
ncbi:MAG: glycosyltransferase family 2 protein [Deltaproteobacteria bacterium]|nr:glycosyltransferase family 2 protein [Deltaproteobacteria bacterium]